jgi:hypothetical protein
MKAYKNFHGSGRPVKTFCGLVKIHKALEGCLMRLRKALETPLGPPLMLMICAKRSLKRTHTAN